MAVWNLKAVHDGKISLYSFTSATFTPGAAAGRNGSTLAQAIAKLSGTSVDNWKNDTAYFNVTSGVMLWTAPATGTYRIDAYGAQGGKAGTNSGTGGLGARIMGDFSLVAGQVIITRI